MKFPSLIVYDSNGKAVSTDFPPLPFVPFVDMAKELLSRYARAQQVIYWGTDGFPDASYRNFQP